MVERDGTGRMGTGMEPPTHPSCGDAPKEGETWVFSASPSVAGAEVSLRADIWGQAPSTVVLGMTEVTAKVLDSDSWTHPHRVTLSRQTWLQPADPVGNVGSQGAAPIAAGSDHPPGLAIPGRRVAEHNKEVQQLCEALEQQIQQEQQRLQQEVGHQLLLSPCNPSWEGTQDPQTPAAAPRWVSGC